MNLERTYEEGKNAVVAAKKITMETAHRTVDLLLKQPNIAWNDYYVKLVKFHEKHGHMNIVADRRNHAMMKLKDFIVENRRLKSSKMLRPDRIVALDRLGFQWNTDDDDESADDGSGTKKKKGGSSGTNDEEREEWMYNFQDLKQYKEANKHTRVPEKYYPRLGLWVQTQRRVYARYFIFEEAGDEGYVKVDEDDETKLVDVGDDWDDPEQYWTRSGRKRKTRTRKSGTQDDGREKIKMKRLNGGTLGIAALKERYDLLKSIKFEYDDYMMWFDKGIEVLGCFRELFGDSCVPENFANIHLVNFVDAVRRDYGRYGIERRTKNPTKNCLNPGRIRRLENMELNWTKADDKWGLTYRKVAMYKRDLGEHYLHSIPKEDTAIYLWAMKQKKLCQEYAGGDKSVIPEWKVERLKRLGLAHDD